MTPEQIDRVFGRGRLKMATGEHVEVFREAAARGERRRYTKRFLKTQEGDFAHWTEREWKILARLIGHGIGCVPEVVQFDRGAIGGTQIVQTYDAGATVDQWATILPVTRNGRTYRHIFEDCAHWWALAHHCVTALQAIHELSLVHLDVKGDNICIPVGPASFDPTARGARMHPLFGQLALIDFAFSLVSREPLAVPLPIGWQTTYDYQSPRLLRALEAGRNGDLAPTRALDWRCDMYSLAAMLKRYLPGDDVVHGEGNAAGWTAERYHAAKALLLAIRDAHDREFATVRPHDELLQATGAQLAASDMIASLDDGWSLARDVDVTNVTALPITPLTRLAPSLHMPVSGVRGPSASAPAAPARAAGAAVDRAAGAPTRAIAKTRAEAALRGARGSKEGGELLTSLPPIFVSPRSATSLPRAVRRRSTSTAVTAIADDSKAFAGVDLRAVAGGAPAGSIDRGGARQHLWVTGALIALISASFVFAVVPQIRDAFPQLALVAHGIGDAMRGVNKRETESSERLAAADRPSAGSDQAAEASQAAQSAASTNGVTNPHLGGDAPSHVSSQASSTQPRDVGGTASSSSTTQSSSGIDAKPTPTPTEDAQATALPLLPKVFAPESVTTTRPAQHASAAASETAGGRPARGPQDKHALPQKLAKGQSTAKAGLTRKDATTVASASPSGNSARDVRKLAMRERALTPSAHSPSSMLASASPHATESNGVSNTPSPGNVASVIDTPRVAESPPASSSSDSTPKPITETRTTESGHVESPASAPTGSGTSAQVAVPSARRVETTRAEPRHEGWLSSLLNLAKRGGRAAPIEDRAGSDARVASASGDARRSLTDANTTTPRSRDPSASYVPPSANVTTRPVVTAPLPRSTSRPPQLASSSEPVSRIAPTSSVPMSAGVTDASQRAAAASLPDAGAIAAPPVADVTTRSVSPTTPAFENAVAVAPGIAPQGSTDGSLDRYDAGAPLGLAAMGKRMVSDYVPRTAAQAEPEIARVLERAGAWYGAEQQPLIVNVARASWGRNALAVPALPSSSVARSSMALKDEARRAFWAQRNFDEAIDLHLRAFGADPYDAELAGNLASLYLRTNPAQPVIARQLAMHAMALTSAQARSPRVQDWGTFAVASALVGRDNDATHALFVTAALANNLGMTCRTALDAVSRYGERMRVPVESMLLRIQQQGRDRESAYCAFPPRWNYASRFY